jgi:hypothetical protein
MGLFLALALPGGFCAAPDKLTSPVETIAIPWGSDEASLGLLNQPEVERVGPISFCIADGKALILDHVNERVAQAVPRQPVQTIAKNVQGISICPDGGGGFFVLSPEKASHFPASGSQGDYPLPRTMRLIEGYGTELTLAPEAGLALCNVDQKSTIVAQGTAAKGFTASADQSAMIREGRPGKATSGLRFIIRRLGGNDIRLIGLDADDKDRIVVRIEMDGDPAGAALFKGQDSSGRLYVEVERIKGSRAELEVHRYAATGERLAVISMPNDYFTTIYKKTEVTSDGSVYQMLTTPDGVRINRY